MIQWQKVPLGMMVRHAETLARTEARLQVVDGKVSCQPDQGGCGQTFGALRDAVDHFRIPESRCYVRDIPMTHETP